MFWNEGLLRELDKLCCSWYVTFESLGLAATRNLSLDNVCGLVLTLTQMQTTTSSLVTENQL